jgi:hypothetical protein
MPHVIMHHNSTHIIIPCLSLLVTSLHLTEQTNEKHLTEQTNGKDNFMGYLSIFKFQEDI